MALNLPSLQHSKLAFGALLLLALLATVWTLPLEQWFAIAHSWIELHPWLGAALYVLAVVVGTVAMLPGSLLMASGGFLFGYGTAVMLSAIAITIGATLACVLGRSVARELVLKRLSGSAKLRALDRAVSKRGAQFVMLARVSMLIPFNLLNYAFGLTGINLRTYALATCVGMLPPILLFVWAGSVARNFDEFMSGSWRSGGAGQLLVGVGVIVLIAAVVILQRAAAAELRRELEEAEL